MSEYSLRLGTNRPPDELFAALRRFDDFPRWSDSTVAVESDGDTSQWTVAFRSGVVRWVQRDTVDAHRLAFEQVEGDFVALSGEWTVEPAASGSAVTYRVSLRTSVPHLAGAIDPMVGRTLLRAARDVVTGAAGDAEVLSGGAALRDDTVRSRL
jgi:uncharacterized membrane protein